MAEEKQRTGMGYGTSCPAKILNSSFQHSEINSHMPPVSRHPPCAHKFFDVLGLTMTAASSLATTQGSPLLHGLLDKYMPNTDDSFDDKAEESLKSARSYFLRRVAERRCAAEQIKSFNSTLKRYDIDEDGGIEVTLQPKTHGSNAPPQVNSIIKRAGRSPPPRHSLGSSSVNLYFIANSASSKIHTNPAPTRASSRIAARARSRSPSLNSRLNGSVQSSQGIGNSPPKSSVSKPPKSPVKITSSPNPKSSSTNTPKESPVKTTNSSPSLQRSAEMYRRRCKKMSSGSTPECEMKVSLQASAFEVETAKNNTPSNIENADNHIMLTRRREAILKFKEFHSDSIKPKVTTTTTRKSKYLADEQSCTSNSTETTMDLYGLSQSMSDLTLSMSEETSPKSIEQGYDIILIKGETVAVQQQTRKSSRFSQSKIADGRAERRNVRRSVGSNPSKPVLMKHSLNVHNHDVITLVRS